MKLKSFNILFFVIVFSIWNNVLAQDNHHILNKNNSIFETEQKNRLSSLGPFEIYNADSTSSIRFQFAGQLRLTFDSRDNGSTVDRTNELSMNARRIRLSLSGTIYNPGLSYKLHLSTAPKSLELMDFYFNYKIKRNLQFRFGQYKAPFTRYRIQSFQNLSFAEWAIVTTYFGAERQMGFAFHNGYENPLEWGYVFGIFTGVNARASHAIGLSKVYCEDVVNPSDLADPGAKAKYQPELFIHLMRNANNIKIQSSNDVERTGFRYSIGTSAAWDLDPTPYQDFRLRLASELLIKYHGVSILTIGYAGYSYIEDQMKTKLTMTGGLCQTSYSINKTYEVSIRYAIVDFQNVLINDALTRAQRLIDNSDDDPDVVKQYKKAGLVSKEQELT
ncbi:MAG: porin, partial [bacterium]